MKVPMTVLRVATLGPALLVSLLLAVVVFALVPPALGLVLFGALAMLVALAPVAARGGSTPTAATRTKVGSSPRMRTPVRDDHPPRRLLQPAMAAAVGALTLRPARESAGPPQASTARHRRDLGSVARDQPRVRDRRR